MLSDLAVVIGFLFVVISPIGLFFRRWRRRSLIAFPVALLALITGSLTQKHAPSKGDAISASPATTAAPAAPISPPAAASQQNARIAPHTIGKAKVCLADEDVKIPPGGQIELPATTIFEDDGALKGDKNDPATWGHSDSKRHASLITLAPVVLTSKSPCGETSVKVFKLFSSSAAEAAVDDNEVFSISDVLDYPIPAKKPLIEVGKLIDDISVKAILIADVSEAYDAPPALDEAGQGALCLATAQKLAVAVGAAVGRQTHSIVELRHPTVNEASVGCTSYASKHHDLFVAWEGSARPPAATGNFIARSAAFVTGASAAEIQQELTSCVGAALKATAQEMADREFRGVKIECQAFARDGGGGSATIYRRYGAEPEHSDLGQTERASVAKSSEEVKASEEAEAQKSLEFAQWWQDPTIPKDVKTFAMWSARVLTLAQKCPEVKPNKLAIAAAAAKAGITTEDIEPNGKYFTLIAQMVLAMQQGAEKESHESACEAARKYK